MLLIVTWSKIRWKLARICMARGIASRGRKRGGGQDGTKCRKLGALYYTSIVWRRRVKKGQQRHGGGCFGDQPSQANRAEVRAKTRDTNIEVTVFGNRVRADSSGTPHRSVTWPTDPLARTPAVRMFLSRCNPRL